MKVRLVAFGIARDILKSKNQDFEFSGKTIDDLKSELIIQFPALSNLRSLSFAVSESYQPDSYLLSEDEEVVIIPPVSGG